MRLVYGQDARVAEWVAAHIPRMGPGTGFGACAAIGIEADDGTPLAGVVYHDWRPTCRDIQMSCATITPRWLTKNLIQNLMAYPFDRLDCQRVTTIVPRKATSVRRFLDTFGFKREGLVRRGFGDDDAVISGLLKREWLRSKWIAPLNPPEDSVGQATANPAASAGPDSGRGRAIGVEHRHGPEPVASEQRELLRASGLRH